MDSNISYEHVAPGVPPDVTPIKNRIRRFHSVCSVQNPVTNCVNIVHNINKYNWQEFFSVQVFCGG